MGYQIIMLNIITTCVVQVPLIVSQMAKGCVEQCVSLTNWQAKINQLYCHANPSRKFKFSTKQDYLLLDPSHFVQRIVLRGIQTAVCSGQKETELTGKTQPKRSTEDNGNTKQILPHLYRNKTLTVYYQRGTYSFNTGVGRWTKWRHKTSHLIADVHNNRVYGIRISCYIYYLQMETQKNTPVYRHNNAVRVLAVDTALGAIFILDKAYLLFRVKNVFGSTPTRLPFKRVPNSMVLDENKKRIYVTDKNSGRYNLLSLTYSGRIVDVYDLKKSFDLCTVDIYENEIIYKKSNNLFTFNTISKREKILHINYIPRAFQFEVNYVTVLNNTRVRIYNRKWKILFEFEPPPKTRKGFSIALL